MKFSKFSSVSGGDCSQIKAILTNAQLVLDDRVSLGSLLIQGDKIGELDHSPGKLGIEQIDCDGDYLLPGLVDLHTDNAEQHFFPRPGVIWPSPLAAMIAHDRQMVGAGVTTVLNAFSFGDFDSSGNRSGILGVAVSCLSRARALELFHADHYLHYRCELSDPGLGALLVEHSDNPYLRLASLMDHTPGQRQWRNLDIFRAYRRRKGGNVWADDDFETYLSDRLSLQAQWVPTHREQVSAFASGRRVRIASHDDTSLADVNQSYGDGVTISEFPTTIEAARHAHGLGMRIVMGAPNVVLGRSHSGNVRASDLAAENLLDVLASDYAPSSLLHAPFLLAAGGVPLHEAIAMVTARPADALGFSDRGRIVPGLRADLLRVRLIDGVPVIRNIWVSGKQYL